MKTLILLGSIVLAYTAAGYDLTESPLRAEVLELLQSNRSIRSEVIAMPEEKKRALLEYVQMQQSRDVGKDFVFTELLMFLGDEATYQNLLAKEAFGTLQNTLDPHVFELIAPAMFRNDQPLKPHTFPHSTYARQAIRDMLRGMPQVPPHVKAWLETFTDTDVNYDESLEIFRAWWTANEAAWRRRDFAALKAGQDMSHRNVPKMRAEKRAKEAGSAITETGVTASGSQPSTEPAASTPRGESSKTFWVRFAILCVVISTIAVGIGAWQASRKARR